MENLKTTPFTIDFLLKHPPFFIKKVARRSQEVGMSQAGFEAFQNANIRIVIEGRSETLQTSGWPAILVADHMSRIDDVLLFAALPLLGREDVKLTAKPYSYNSHLVEVFKRQGEEYIIPFVPSYMAKDKRSTIPFEERVMKYLLRKKLLTKEEIQNLNNESFVKAATLVAEGNAVNFLPEGSSAKGTQPWKKGIGEVIKLLPDHMYDQITIVPYRFEGVHQKRVQLTALFTEIARLLPEQVIILRLGQEATLQELFSGFDIQNLSASEIALELQNWYKKQF